MLYANCSECGRSYGARRVTSGANYCSPTCKQRAYRSRAKQRKLAQEGTYDMDLYVAVQRLAGRYGSDVGDMLVSVMRDNSPNALRQTIAIIDTIVPRRVKSNVKDIA